MNPQTIISDLMAAGMTQGEIANAIGSSQQHISDLYRGERGKRIGFELGQKLQLLHKKRCRKTKTAA